MKYIIIIILIFTSLSCEKGEITQSSNSKEYIFDYAKEDSISDDVSNFYGIQSFQLENFLSPISREQYKKDSLEFKNEYIIKENSLVTQNILVVPYGKIKFVNNDKENSDLVSKYSYSGFSNLLNSHIIKISLYESELYLLLKNNKYEYRFLQSEPIISSDKTKTLTFKNSDGLNSTLSIYNVKDKNLNLEKTIWSEENLIENSFWNSSNLVTIKVRNIHQNKISYYRVNTIQSVSVPKQINIETLMKTNLSSPQNVTNSLIFTKDKSGKLLINNEYLSFIQNNTTPNENTYCIALSNYIKRLIIKYYDDGDRTWTEEELFKIIAFASNTTDPLFKKYWKNNLNEWEDGKSGNILGFCNVAYHNKIWGKLIVNFESNNNYNLSNLEDMIYYASEFDITGAP